MEWWGWITWSVTAAIALGALVLGVRAERRATRYEALWVPRAGMPTRVFNRTGEDARDVRVRLERGTLIAGWLEYPLIEANDSISIHVKPDDGEESFGLEVIWIRPRDGKTYHWPKEDRWWQTLWKRLRRAKP